jgi:uncharacterized beta-barrel protein YwiB (DUF1934 family)
MSIPLFIKSTIHAVGNEYPDVIEQQVDAELLHVEDEIQLYYQEGQGEEASTVRIFSFEDRMIIWRNGPIRYEQTYVTGESTVCEMVIPGGKIDVVVNTQLYNRTSQKIICQFTLEQANHMKLGDYQIELAWEL